MPLDATDASVLQRHPMGVSHDATALTAYRDAIVLSDADKQKVIDTINEGLNRAVKQSKTDEPGVYDYTKVEGMGQTSDEVQAKIVEKNSALTGYHLALKESVEARLEKERKEAEAEKARLSRTVRRSRVSVTDLVNPYDDLLATAEATTIREAMGDRNFRKFVRSIPEGIQGRDIFAAVFTTDSFDPFNMRDPSVTMAAENQLYLIQAIPMIPLDQESAVYMEETTNTSAAAGAAEGAALAESTFQVTERTREAEIIGHTLPVTMRVLDDEAQARDYLNVRMPRSTMLAADAQIVVGNGTSPQLDGIANKAGAGNVTMTKGAADEITDMFDFLLDAETNVRFTGEATPTHFTINPTSWNDAKKQKGTASGYYGGNPWQGFSEQAWGLPVIRNKNFERGAGKKTGACLDLTGEFIQTRMRRDVTTEIGESDDDFKKLQYTLRSWMRMALVIKRAAAICHLTQAA